MTKKEPKLRVETRVSKTMRDQIDQIAAAETRGNRSTYLYNLIVKDLKSKKLLNRDLPS